MAFALDAMFVVRARLCASAAIVDVVFKIGAYAETGRKIFAIANDFDVDAFGGLTGLRRLARLAASSAIERIACEIGASILVATRCRTTFGTACLSFAFALSGISALQCFDFASIGGIAVAITRPNGANAFAAGTKHIPETCIAAYAAMIGVRLEIIALRTA